MISRNMTKTEKTQTLRVSSIISLLPGVVVGGVAGATFLWPWGERLRMFSCSPGLMGESPVCQSTNQTDLWGWSIGNHVGITGALLGALIGGVVLLLLVAGVKIVRARVPSTTRDL